MSERLENNLEKGENAGYQHFLLFPELFSKVFSVRFVKTRERVVKNRILYQKKEFRINIFGYISDKISEKHENYQNGQK